MMNSFAQKEKHKYDHLILYKFTCLTPCCCPCCPVPDNALRNSSDRILTTFVMTKKLLDNILISISDILSEIYVKLALSNVKSLSPLNFI